MLPSSKTILLAIIPVSVGFSWYHFGLPLDIFLIGCLGLILYGVYEAATKED